MRELTTAEIEKLAGKTGVRRIAVENFLGTAGQCELDWEVANLYNDSCNYNWNAATVKAIYKGLLMVHEREA